MDEPARGARERALPRPTPQAFACPPSPITRLTPPDPEPDAIPLDTHALLHSASLLFLSQTAGRAGEFVQIVLRWGAAVSAAPRPLAWEPNPFAGPSPSESPVTAALFPLPAGPPGGPPGPPGVRHAAGTPPPGRTALPPLSATPSAGPGSTPDNALLAAAAAWHRGTTPSRPHTPWLRQHDATPSSPSLRLDPAALLRDPLSPHSPRPAVAPTPPRDRHLELLRAHRCFLCFGDAYVTDTYALCERVAGAPILVLGCYVPDPALAGARSLDQVPLGIVAVPRARWSSDEPLAAAMRVVASFSYRPSSVPFAAPNRAAEASRLVDPRAVPAASPPQSPRRSSVFAAELSTAAAAALPTPSPSSMSLPPDRASASLSSPAPAQVRSPVAGLAGDPSAALLARVLHILATSQWTAAEHAAGRRVLSLRTAAPPDASRPLALIPSIEAESSALRRVDAFDSRTLILVSCILPRGHTTHIVTSADCVRAAQLIAGRPLTVREKNRVRRNLEEFGPATVNKGTDFFRQVAAYDRPLARTIEKSFKVFPFSNFFRMLVKIAQKYSSESPGLQLVIPRA